MCVLLFNKIKYQIASPMRNVAPVTCMHVTCTARAGDNMHNATCMLVQ